MCLDAIQGVCRHPYKEMKVIPGQEIDWGEPPKGAAGVLFGDEPWNMTDFRSPTQSLRMRHKVRCGVCGEIYEANIVYEDPGRF